MFCFKNKSRNWKNEWTGKCLWANWVREISSARDIDCRDGISKWWRSTHRKYFFKNAASLQNPVLQKEWQLSSVEISLLTSLFYLGMGIGAITGGKFGEKMGRVFFLKIGSLLQVLFASLFFFISTPIQLMIVRALYGIGCGISLSLTTSIAA